MLVPSYRKFSKKMHKFSEGHLELPYSHGFMSHKNICLVYVHFGLRKPIQLLLNVENDHFYPQRYEIPMLRSPIVYAFPY